MTDHTNTLSMTVGIVANYVSNNRVSPEELPNLIIAVNGALKGTGEAVEPEAEAVEKPTASQIRKSVTDAGIVSFLDGKTYQSIKRHLSTQGMSVQEYRARYGLPDAYPTVAPAYAARRSEIAKRLGLGQRSGTANATSPEAAPAPKKRSQVTKPAAAATPTTGE